MKADVFHAYLSLLKQTRPAQSWLCDPDAMEQGETPLTMLQNQVKHTERESERHRPDLKLYKPMVGEVLLAKDPKYVPCDISKIHIFGLFWHVPY